MQLVDRDITLISAPAIILQGVNCQGVMGAGVAKAIGIKWPFVKQCYLRAKEEMILGNIQPVEVEPNLYIVNCYTQKYYGWDGRRYASLEAITKCLNKAVQFASSLNISTVYSVQLGCGLGGLPWDEVEPIFKSFEPTVEFIICRK